MYQACHENLPIGYYKFNLQLSDVMCNNTNNSFLGVLLNRMSGVRLGYSRVEDGFIMQFTDLSHILCFSGGPWTTSNSRMLLLSKLPWSSDTLDFYCSNLVVINSFLLEMKIMLYGKLVFMIYVLWGTFGWIAGKAGKC